MLRENIFLNKKLWKREDVSLVLLGMVQASSLPLQLGATVTSETKFVGCSAGRTQTSWRQSEVGLQKRPEDWNSWPRREDQMACSCLV